MRKLLGCCLVLLPALNAPAADVRGALLELRISQCGLSAAESQRWRPNRELDAAAARWARGETLRRAVDGSGYVATAVGALHVSLRGAAASVDLDHESCSVLRNRALDEAGVERRGREYWIVFASRAELPMQSDLAGVAQRALQSINDARARARICGERRMPAATPLRLSSLLSAVADQHARDMALHHYFDHRDLTGKLPADRVKAAGYRERLVGENIAFGPLSTEAAIKGWLASPGHCENLMDSRFQEMGIAFAQARGTERGVYWVQVLADPLN